ncbi:catalase [Helicobacter pullorum NCTC 12824]|uniref:catalase n=1 Tax=Helicobacter pullorum TaxID=35818 RepID=UPI001243F7AC|nr:catalase [Helicobacter pullorum]KAB0575309.1 catalase [Helicobacter pullorum NCTC 12824]
MLKNFKKVLTICASTCLLGTFVNAQETIYDPDKIAEIFYKLNGDPNDSKARVNHKKGFCANATFIADKNFNLSNLNIPLFNQAAIPVQVRYSLGGAIQDDKSKQRGMALKFMGNEDSWTMVMLNTEINFAKNPKEFGQFFEMKIPNLMDPKTIDDLNNNVDSYKNFSAYLDKIGISSLEHTPFYSIHTFWFKEKGKDKTIPARWKFIPKDGISYLSQSELKSASKDFLKEDFIAYTKNKPIEYQMYLEFPNKGDAVDDTTALWTGDHKTLLVGTLKVEKYDGEACNQDVYFPSELPSGVEAPIDPLFDLRTPTYAITFGKRQ